MFWKEFWALLVADSFSTNGWKLVTLAVPGGSPIGPPRAVLVEAFDAPPNPKPPVVFAVVLLPPNKPPPVLGVAAPKAGLLAAVDPKRLVLVPPPKGLEVDAVLLFVPKPPPNPVPEVAGVVPPNKPPPPVLVDVPPKAGFAPKALLFVAPKPREYHVSTTT